MTNTNSTTKAKAVKTAGTNATRLAAEKSTKVVNWAAGAQNKAVKKEKTVSAAQVSSVLAVRVDPELKKAAEEVFAERGKKLSEEVRAYLRRVVARSQDQYYCRKTEVENVMGAFSLGDTRKVQLVSKKTKVDC